MAYVSMFRRLHPSFLTICLMLAACATEPVGHKNLLEFLTDGVTRRDDILGELGVPSARYERSQILAYRLRKDEDRYVLVGRSRGWYGVHYSLVFVFDEDGVLRRHSVVEVRPP